MSSVGTPFFMPHHNNLHKTVVIDEINCCLSLTVGICYAVSISKIHLQERCKMEMLYAICDAATGPLIETDHIFGIVVADSQEVAHDLLTADP